MIIKNKDNQDENGRRKRTYKGNKQKIVRFSDVLNIFECVLSVVAGWLFGNKIYFICIPCILAIAMLWAVSITYRRIEEIENELEDSIYRKSLMDDLDSAKNREEKDVIRLMLKNNDEIEEYFEISKKQEKTSYNVSVTCACVGVMMLGASVFAVIFDIGIEATLVAIIDGAITEVVSGIVLWIHDKSATQLNHYYGALHENEKFLSAINLADRLKNETKDQMYMEIIRAQIGAGKEEKQGAEPEENKG